MDVNHLEMNCHEFKQNKIHLLKNKTSKENQSQQQPKHKKAKENKKINLNKTKTFGKKQKNLETMPQFCCLGL